MEREQRALGADLGDHMITRWLLAFAALFFAVPCQAITGLIVSLKGSDAAAGIDVNSVFSLSYTGYVAGYYPEDAYITFALADGSLAVGDVLFNQNVIATYNFFQERIYVSGTAGSSEFSISTGFQPHPFGATTKRITSFSFGRIDAPLNSIDLSNFYRATIFIGEIPEPSIWMVIVIGFGAIGTATRRKQRKLFAS